MASTKEKIVGVVDDDLDIRRALQRLLTVHGYAVKSYASGEDFIVDLRRVELSCIVVDINLGGMTGIELCQQLTALGFTVPVILITAFDSPSMRQQAKDAGCVSYLLKPFPASLLFEAIDKADA